MWIHRCTAVGSLLVAIGLYVASIWSGEEMGYQFPRVVAIGMIVLALLFTVSAFKGRGMTLAADEEPIPWGSIWPALAVFIVYLLVARTLGFFVSSFLAFLAITQLYAPGGRGLRPLAVSAAIGLVFMGVLYVVFVALLNVQMPRGWFI